MTTLSFNSPIGPFDVELTDEAVIQRVNLRVDSLNRDTNSPFQLLGVEPASLSTAQQSIAKAFEDYFHTGRLQYFASFQLGFDIVTVSVFQRSVLEALRCIPDGETWSYGQLANAIAKPGAARAVGTACATNPWPIVLPCHRVVQASGALGGYMGQPDDGEDASWRKRWLLEHEKKTAKAFA